MPADPSSSSATGVPWNRIARPLRLACIVLPALLFGGLAWVDYWVELERTRVDVVTSTNAVAEHARTVVETVDLVISRVLNRIDQQDWPTLATTPETHEFLDRLRRELPQIEAVSDRSRWHDRGQQSRIPDAALRRALRRLLRKRDGGQRRCRDQPAIRRHEVGHHGLHGHPRQDARTASSTAWSA